MNLIQTRDWTHTEEDEPRGYIQPKKLTELWFHTGTACNLSCPFCLEGSKPGDDRLNRISLGDVRSYMDEAVELGVEQFSFTGGEPFVVKDIVRILEYASKLKPCLVLTNGTEPVLRREKDLLKLVGSHHPISFRVSIDYVDEERHDAGRGKGSFANALQGMALLENLGFKVSLARQMEKGEDSNAVDEQFRQLLAAHGISQDMTIVSFPDFLPPESLADVPAITEHCMTTYQTEANRAAYMCAFSKMLVKQNGKMVIYACTLVDDDPRYGFTGTLKESIQPRVMLRHHRCFSCFSFGASCSEI